MKYFLYVDPDGKVMIARTMTELIRSEGEYKEPVPAEEIEKLNERFPGDSPRIAAGATLLILSETFVGFLGEMSLFGRDHLVLLVSENIKITLRPQYVAPMLPGGLYEIRSEGVTVLGHDMERTKNGFSVTDRTGLTTTVTPA